MKRTLLSTMLLASSVCASNLLIEDAKRFKSYAVIVVISNSGLNNFNNCSELSMKNIKKIEESLSKQYIKKMRLKRIEYISFNESIKTIASIEEKRSAKLFKESQKVIPLISKTLQEDTSNRANDVVAALQYTSSLIKENYRNYDEIGILIASNLRDSSHNASYFKSMKPIMFPENVSITIFGNSGLQCSKASSSQKLSSEANAKSFWVSKIKAKSLDIKTIY